jgi:hypothetical protein
MELGNEHEVINKPVDTVAVCVKVGVPNTFAPVLNVIFARVRKDCLRRMLYLRQTSSSKYTRRYRAW